MFLKHDEKCEYCESRMLSGHQGTFHKTSNHWEMGKISAQILSRQVWTGDEVVKLWNWEDVHWLNEIFLWKKELANCAALRSRSLKVPVTQQSWPSTRPRPDLRCAKIIAPRRTGSLPARTSVSWSCLQHQPTEPGSTWRWPVWRAPGPPRRCPSTWSRTSARQRSLLLRLFVPPDEKTFFL